MQTGNRTHPRNNCRLEIGTRTRRTDTRLRGWSILRRERSTQNQEFGSPSLRFGTRNRTKNSCPMGFERMKTARRATLATTGPSSRWRSTMAS